MNSRQPRQATWRTRDGSPWWLRNSRYGEPNGDYSANCFLYIGHHNDPRRFNDHWCAYHSRSYYCQPVRTNPLYGFRGKKAPKIVRRPPRKPKRNPRCACKAVLYKHSQFRGHRGVFCMGHYRYKQFVRKVRNDDVSSVYVYGKHCVADMFEHGGFNGWRARYATGAHNAAGFRYVGNHRNDKASSLRVYKDRCKVLLCEHAHFRGRCRWMHSGSYRYHQFLRYSRNDAVSSLRLYGKHCYADMYEHGSFNGRRARYATGNRNEIHVRYVGGHWNDKFSSARVFRR